MVFSTPAVIAGDSTGGRVVSHELAHSWTGNLITNASNNDFWLNEVGRNAFDNFLKKYILKFKFQCIDIDTFLTFLKKNLPGIEEEVDLDAWIDGTGIPADAMEPISRIHNKVLSVCRDFTAAQMPSDEEVNNWQGQEWQLFLENLSKKLGS